MRFRALRTAAMVLFAQSLLSMCVGSANGEATAPLYSEPFDQRCEGQTLPCGWSSSAGTARIGQGLFEEENALMIPAGATVSFVASAATPFHAPSTELTFVVPIYCETDNALSVAVELSAESDAGVVLESYTGTTEGHSRQWKRSATTLRTATVRSGSYSLRGIRLSNTGGSPCWLGELLLYDDWQNADAPNAC